MNQAKMEKQYKKNNPEDSFLQWWKKNKTLIAILSVFIPFAVGFNLFLHQWVIKPMAEKRVFEVEIEFNENAKNIIEYYEKQIKDLKNIINNKENELQSLRTKFAKLQNQGINQREFELLKQEIALKEKEIKFYKEEIRYLKYQLNKAKQILELPKKSKIAQKIEPMQRLENKVIEKDNSIKGLTRFRSNAKFLSSDEVKSMVMRHDFFHYFENRNGHGFPNKFEIKIINNDKVVFDRASGLMWQQSGSILHNYDLAKEYINQINHQGYAGYKDWRMPTLEEAMSLVESLEPVEPEMIGEMLINPVFDNKQKWIWTSDQVQKKYAYQNGSRVLVWFVDFTTGYCNSTVFNNWLFVRAVRSGQ